MKMPARCEGGFPVFPYIHGAPHAVPIDGAFECVTDAGSLVTMIAVAAHLCAFHFAANIRGEELAAMAAHHLLSLLLEEQRVHGVVPRVGDLKVPLAGDLGGGSGRSLFFMARRIRQGRMN